MDKDSRKGRIIKKKEKFSLKDHLFNKKKVAYLTARIKDTYQKFDDKKFEKDVMSQFPKLELKERISHMTVILEKYLPTDYERAVKILIKSLPKQLDQNKTDDDFGDFIFSPFSYFVSQNGCEKKYLKISFSALSEITKRFTVEGDIRFFINKFPKESYDFMQKMSKSKNYHERRLASEGLRPKLPWCIGISFGYKKSVDILDNLFYDKTRYVTRSVSNHLNDISKFDPDFVLKTLKRWEKTKKQNTIEMDFIKNHSLRTSIKNGHKETLKYLGYGSKPKLEKVKLTLNSNRVNMGENLDFTFQARSLKNQDLLLDYKIFFQTKSGKMSPKVLKLKKVRVEKGEKIEISKKYSFAPKTTKTFYPGEHRLEILINGDLVVSKKFELN